MSSGLRIASIVVAAALSACSPKSGGATPTSGCTLPQAGSGRARLVNVGTSGAADFCVRVSGTSDWGSPVLAGGGTEGLCVKGLGYAQASVPFAVPAGSLDVKALPAGSACGAAGTSEIDRVAVGTEASGAPPVTMIRMGGGSSPERLVALQEEATPRSSVDALRLVNALSGNDSINMGIATDPVLPTTVDSNAFPQGVPPGSAAPPGSGVLGTTDASGYTALLVQPLHIGVNYSAETSAIFIVDTPHRTDRKTLFAIGDPGDPSNAHPPRGLYCEDLEASSLVDGGAAGGDSALLASCALTPLPAPSTGDE